MIVSPQELERWVRELKAGNNRSLAVIFERCGDHCLHTLQKQTGCTLPDAEDILQDAILIFRVNLLHDKVSHPRNLAGYLYTICRNLQRTQAERRYSRSTQQDEVLRQMYEAATSSDCASQEAKKKLTLVWTAFEQLRPGCQRILRRFYLQHQSISEITKELNLANNGVTRSTKSQCFRCWMDQIEQLQQRQAISNANLS